MRYAVRAPRTSCDREVEGYQYLCGCGQEDGVRQLQQARHARRLFRNADATFFELRYCHVAILLARAVEARVQRAIL